MSNFLNNKKNKILGIVIMIMILLLIPNFTFADTENKTTKITLKTDSSIIEVEGKITFEIEDQGGSPWILYQKNMNSGTPGEEKLINTGNRTKGYRW